MTIVMTLLGFSIFGVIVCRLISFYAFQKNSRITNLFCGTADNKNCSGLLPKSLSRKYGYINFGDFGVVYFSATSFFLLLTLLLFDRYELSILILAIPFTITFLLSLISLLYQKIVAKLWCKFCLIVVATVWAQFLFVLIGFSKININSFEFNYSPSHNVLSLLIIYCTSLLICCFWLKYKITFGKWHESEKRLNSLRKWKHDPKIFMSILNSQSRAIANDFEKEIWLGKHDAPIQMIIATNLYCRACADEYFALHRLLIKYPSELRVIIKLNSKEEKPEYNFNLANKYIIAAFEHIKEQLDRMQIFNQWFLTMNLTEWKKVFYDVQPLNDYSDYFREHHNFFVSNRISRTPSVFLDGYAFPDGFDITDLDYLIPKLVKKTY